jgi:murein DD-endopeptidase MepM/ murein hydrolase activator NlpD
MSSEALQLQRQMLAQLVAIHKETAKATNELKSKKRLLSLGFAWAFYLVLNLGSASLAWYNAAASSMAGRLLGLPPITDAPMKEAPDHPLEKGDSIGQWKLTSGFGYRPAPCAGCSSYHQGVDINTPIGTPLVMPWRGQVACSWSKGGGNVASITAPGKESIKLLHLAKCTPGHHDAGATIAATGNTGLGTGPHLDVRVYRAGAPVPPGRQVVEKMLGAGDIGRLRRAIVGKESGGKYGAVNPHSGALGAGQVMPANVPSWSKQALGRPLSPAEFLASPEVQDKVIDHKLSTYLQEELAATGGDRDTAIRRVASRWYSGQADLYQNRKPQRYGAGQYPSIDAYTRDILKRYQEAP